jgi:hypothetical protein
VKPLVVDKGEGMNQRLPSCVHHELISLILIAQDNGREVSCAANLQVATIQGKFSENRTCLHPLLSTAHSRKVPVGI